MINFAVGALGAFSAALLALLGDPVRLELLARGDRRGRGRRCVRRRGRVDGDHPLVPRAARHRARRDDRHRASSRSRPRSRSRTIDDASLSTPVPDRASPAPGRSPGYSVRGAELSVLIAVPLITLALTWFLTRTDIGKAVRAAAANPDRARLSAINPKLLSTLVWTIGGLLSAVSLILLAGTVRQRRRSHDDRPQHVEPGARRRADRADGVVPAGARGRCRDRCRRGGRQVQHADAEPACSTRCCSSSC